ncbi:hypothetical protein PFICI_10474 [Pestalotiopsis fici W106-1]|uniref:Arrestin-like N-terminal domain-containing protein n=1 Tax=Pestalotiopsis fici (strain W106-1 / CGMCC3.15140) TaxID=1229662 RepID=W3WZ64_PESFW|nr:uncharacterized protein PFICI_10474 [Pestalotiopsis fici W106-1]ETS78412.1 hypothetical protein PFICI_10474 [Pestalotiopsis fici W106-1]
MPRRGIRQSHEVSIQIADFQSTYLPGDVIIGHVVAKKAFGHGPRTDQTVVKLRLFGRTKSKIVSGSQEKTYRGQAVLVDEEQCIFRGTVSANSKHSFAMTIPKTPQPGVAKTGDSWDKDERGLRGIDKDRNFLSNTQEDITKHSLPAVFYFGDSRALTGSVCEAFVEYFLEATLACPGVSDAKATLPLFIRSHSTEKPVDYNDYSFNVKSFQQITRSERLLPQNRDKKMTFRDKSKRLFTPSKVPSYSYRVSVATPPVIQLDHPAPVPFKVHVAPIMEQNKMICPDGDIRRLPPIELVSVDMELVALTRVRCPGTLGDHSRDKETTYRIPIDEPIALANYNIPVVVQGDLKGPGDEPRDLSERANEQTAPGGSPFLEPNSLHVAVEGAVVPEGLIKHSSFQPHEKGQYFLGTPLDLGNNLDVRLTETKSSSLGGRPTTFEKRLWPSFATYNIVLSYQLVWKLKISCVGEIHTTEGRANVNILPPSEAQGAGRQKIGQDAIKDYEHLTAALNFTSEVGGFLDLLSV